MSKASEIKAAILALHPDFQMHRFWDEGHRVAREAAAELAAAAIAEVEAERQRLADFEARAARYATWWVPVVECMPPHDGLVLVTEDARGVYPALGRYVGGMWEVERRHPFDRITHWMRLPEFGPAAGLAAEGEE